MNNGRRSKRVGVTGRGHGSNDSRIAKLLREINTSYAIFERRLAVAVSVSTDGTGRVAIGTLASSASVSGLTDFTKLAGLFLAYRVKGMQTTLNPTFRSNVAGVAPSPSTLVTFGFIGGLAAANYQDAIDSNDFKIHYGYAQAIRAAIDWTNNTDAHLWTPTNVAVSSGEAYGLAIVEDSTATVSQISTKYYSGVTEYIVEFMAPA